MVIHAAAVPDPDFIPQRIHFKETVSGPAKSIEGKFFAQSGGRGEYGHVLIDVEPAGLGKGIVFINKIKGEAIPAKFIKSVEDGIRREALHGVLAGYPVTDISVALVDGSSHEVDSNDAAFQQAAGKALRAALLKGKSILLEPIMKCKITVREEYLGAIVGDLTTRRAQILSLGLEKNCRVVDVHIPLIEMTNYAATVHSLSKETVSLLIEAGQYAPAPSEIAKKVIESRDNNPP
jgi:elongation factor G